MAITVSSITILGTACPWKLGSGASSTGASGVLVPYNTKYWDGSAAASGGASQNAAYPYGASHTHAGETAPTIIAVTPKQVVFLKYVSGTVATQSSGAGNSGPAGSPTTGVTPYPAGGADTETLPTNVIPGFSGVNANGTVNTSGTAVTWVSGPTFTSRMIVNPIWINNVAFTIASVNSPTSITLTATAGTQTGVTYLFWGAKTSIGGIVGAFTDSSGNIISTFDWASYGGVTPAGAFTLSSTGSGSYNGTITGGAANAFAGYFFTITGFTNSVNNGTFLCTASAAGSLTLLNPSNVAETHAGSAQQISVIGLKVPTGAAFISLGVNDTVLWDNTGSFSMTAFIMETDFQYTGDQATFKHYPITNATPAFGGDMAKLQSSVFLEPYEISQTAAGAKLVQGYFGQLFPRAGNPSGTVGQVFPY